MFSIDFTAPFGDERCEVSITKVMPGSGSQWHIRVDNYYCGRVWHTEHFGWRSDMPANSMLSTADFTEIIALIEASDGEIIPLKTV